MKTFLSQKKRKNSEVMADEESLSSLESPCATERAKRAECVKMQSARSFREKFGVHYDDFSIARAFTEYKQSSSRLNKSVEMQRESEPDDAQPYEVVSDLNHQDKLRGQLNRHILKTEKFRFLKDKGITILDPVSEIELHKQT